MRLRAHLLVFLVCLALVVLWTWPLARDPGHLVPDNTDPRLFSWVMLSVYRNLLTRPHFLLHGNAFHPYGSSLTFAEPLLTPALVMGPLHALADNPYFAYNLTLLLFWAASGWAMYAVTFWLTRCHPAAAAAMLVFTIAPPRIEYAVEFQMEMMFGLPLAVYALARYLETQRARYLLGFLAAFWLQAVAVWYFAVILGCGLVVLALSYALRRWSGWRPRALLAGAAGGVALAAALAPVAWPFFVTRRELGLERDIEDAIGRAADVLSYATADGIWLPQLARLNYGHETTLFPGLVALGLVLLATAWLRAARSAAPGAGWPERLVAVAMVASVVVGVLTVLGGERLTIGSVAIPLPWLTTCGVVLLAAWLLRDGLAGWRRWRAGLTERRLAPGEWVSSLGVMGLLAWLLSLGPVVTVADVPIGPGLYAWLHPYVLPLRAVRSTTRFGLLVLLVLALLAGLGVAWLAGRLRGPRRRWALGAVLGLLLLDYVHTPLEYVRVENWRRPVDAVLRADPDDVAMIEWPLNRSAVDVDAKLRSVSHGKRVVNGYAGFVVASEQWLSGLLTRANPPFASPEARTALREIYPLRYLVVRDAGTRPTERWPTGAALAALSDGFLRYRGTYGGDDLYELALVPEQGHVLERLAPYDLVRTRPVLRAAVGPVRTEVGVAQSVQVLLNDRLLVERALEDLTVITATLDGPLRRTAPNVITFVHDYRREPPGVTAAHQIGTTGVSVAVDILVRSAGQPHGNLASFRVGRDELAARRRGYMLAVLGPDGEIRNPAIFDTHASAAASEQLAAWVAALPVGAIVLGAVRDDAAQQLSAEAVQALATLGVRGDLRGRYRESHAFVGVKGAPPGSADEAQGASLVEVHVGEPDAGFALELREFALEPAPAAGRRP